MTLTLGLPSKGRLREETLARFAAAGLAISESADQRAYRATIAAAPGVEVRFLSAGEIAGELASGALDMGVTGQDLLAENVADLESRIGIAAHLGYGHADVVVAVPEVWYDVRTMADLEDVAADFRARHGRRLRIATKYWRLTQEFFSRTHSIQVYRIVESLGATEGAPASGQADVIVDITTTGSTLRANHLRVLDDGVILQSQACLAVAIAARDPADTAALERIAAAFSRP